MKKIFDNHYRTGICRRSLSIEPGNDAMVPFWLSIDEVELDAGMVEFDAGMVEFDARVACTPINVGKNINENKSMFIANSTEILVCLSFELKVFI